MDIKRKKTAFLLAVLTSLAVFQSSAVNVSAMFGSTLRDTEDVEVTIRTDKDRTQISKYIYGINDDCSISDVSVTALKQSGVGITSYNWETNVSNSGADDSYISSYDLVSAFSKNVLSTPALHAKTLIDKSDLYDIPSKYITLQMMGYVANDAAGVVNKGEDRRWAEVRFNKTEDLLIHPDVSDDTVFMDEYVSYLVNSRGFASDGGITGYFLDSEPENWRSIFGILSLDQLTASELVQKSSSLSKAVKSVDPTAQVLGPSVKGIEAFVNLKNEQDWQQYNETYSWFIDYYLDNMRIASEKEGKRLLDVLDLHFITEAKSALLEPVITTDSRFANEERMQAVRILWDSNYTENSSIARLYKQHTPLIPMIQASIRMYYPGTKLSFSEYNFGGGDDISGGIAQADLLGIFGREGVYMACLKPDGDASYQKAAINLYRDYDGKGASYGDVSVYADNNGDVMSSVYASVESDDASALKMVLINKNMTSTKTAVVNIESKADYGSAMVYSLNKDTSEIIEDSVVENIEDNSFEFRMDPMTVYMFEFETSDILQEEPVVSESADETLLEEEVSSEKETEISEKTDITVSSVKTTEVSVSEEVSADTKETVTENSVETQVSEVSSENAAVTTVVTTAVTDKSDEADESDKTDDTVISEKVTTDILPGEEPEESGVPMAVKVIVSLLVSAVVIALIYVVVTDFILAHKKK